MKKSKIISLYNYVFDDIFFLFFLFYLFKVFSSSFYFLTILLCVVLIVICKKKVLFLFSILVICSSFSLYSSALPTISKARVYAIHSSYVEVKNGSFKAIVYTGGEDILYDSILSLKGEPELIESSPSTFGNDFSTTCHHKNIYYSYNAKQYTILRTGTSLRALLQSRCIASSNSVICKKIVLGITDNSFHDYLFTYGFNLTSSITLICSILRFFIKDTYCKKVQMVLALLLACVYHFPLLLMQYLLFCLISYTKLDQDQQIGFVGIFLLLLYPEGYCLPSFLYPITFKICSLCIKKHKKLWSLNISLCLQSLLFQSMNPIFTLCYEVVKFITGAMYLFALGYCFIDLDFLIYLINYLNKVGNFMMKWEMAGSIKGLGTIGIFFFLFSFRKKKYYPIFFLVTILLSQYYGLYHPFSEITFINVGQGNAILIKDIFKKETILIDTGKASAYSKLDTYLQAKGIQKLDALIVTHSDEDHSGNVETLQKEYEVTEVINTHIDTYIKGRFVFYDLNDINDEDNTNNSSIVTYFQWNKLKYLFMADADSSVEKTIIEKYGQLKADILQASHHGSKTGTSNLLLDTIRPRLTIFSAGINNMYGHPSSETIQRLLKQHLPYMNTAEEGDISIISVGSINLVMTSSGKIGIIHTV